MTVPWCIGAGRLNRGELNPRGWSQIDFEVKTTEACVGFDRGCWCIKCLILLDEDDGVLTRIQERFAAQLQQRERLSSLIREPINDQLPLVCKSKPLIGHPPHILRKAIEVDKMVVSNVHTDGAAWFEAFLKRLMDQRNGDEVWEGRLIWAAAQRDDFLQFTALWIQIGAELAHLLPTPDYPSRQQAGYRAPFFDVAIGSSLGFFWLLDLEWEAQLTAAIVNSIAYWADMVAGVDAPEGDLAKIFDVLPSLTRACATGQADQLSPFKALTMEFVAVQMVQPHTGPLPLLQDIWMSRLADVGGRESATLAACPEPFSENRSLDNTRCLMAWGIMHDLFDFPRDLASGNKVNGVLWALFFGYSGRAVVNWLRETLSIAAAGSAASCASKLLISMAFVHVTNPRWAINGIAARRCGEWPKAPYLSEHRDNVLTMPSVKGDTQFQATGVCVCRASGPSSALALAVRDALEGSVEGFSCDEERLRAHGVGMSAIVEGDWDTLVEISRTTWGNFLEDLDNIADWIDGKIGKE